MAGTENEKIRGTDSDPVPANQVGGPGGTGKYKDDVDNGRAELTIEGTPRVQEPEPWTGLTSPSPRR